MPEHAFWNISYSKGFWKNINNKNYINKKSFFFVLKFRQFKIPTCFYIDKTSAKIEER